MHGLMDGDEWDTLVETYIKNRMVFDMDDDLSTVELQSDLMHLRRLLLGLGVQTAKERGLQPDSPAAQQIINRADIIANHIAWAFPSVDKGDTKERVRGAMRMTWGVPPHLVVEEGRKNGGLETDGMLDEGVGKYLMSPFRSPQVDRMLARALHDRELSNFIARQAGYASLDSPLKESNGSVIGSWLWNRFVALIIAVVMCAGLLFLKSYVPATPDWVLVGGLLLLAGGWLLWTVVSCVLLLIHGPRIAEARKEARGAFRAALDFYGEFWNTAGPISLAHYRKRMEEAKAAGIVWPQALWALVDDMEARGVRHF